MSESQIKVTPIDRMGSDLTVVNSARVSFGKKATTMKESDEKLIKYLAKEGHTSPFGHCFASFHVKAPIFVARQLVKHKFLRWNEISRRYVDSKPEFYTPDTWRGKAENKKQGSEGVVKEVLELEDGPYFTPSDGFGLCSEMYDMLLSKGVCPEQARMVLPTAQMTEFYWSGSLDAFADMCILRLDEHSQYETQLVAKQIDSYMSEWYPISWRELLYGEE